MKGNINKETKDIEIGEIRIYQAYPEIRGLTKLKSNRDYLFTLNHSRSSVKFGATLADNKKENISDENVYSDVLFMNITEKMSDEEWKHLLRFFIVRLEKYDKE